MVSRLLEAHGFEVEVFRSADHFLNRSLDNGPACLLLDQRMPDKTGLELFEEMAAPAWLQVVFLTGHHDVDVAVHAIKSGAFDFLLKPFETAHLVDVVRRALERSAEVIENERARDRLLNRLMTLTPREREVARLLTHGLLNKQIAGRLGASEKTIKIHRSRILNKLQVVSVAECARLIERFGLDKLLQ